MTRLHAIILTLAFSAGVALPQVAQVTTASAAAGTVLSPAAGAVTPSDPATPAAAPSPDSALTPTDPATPVIVPIVIPDPEADPGGFVESFLAMWRNGGKVPTVLFGLMGVIIVLRRRVAWFQVGWRATAVLLVSAGLSTLIDTWASTGAAGNLWMWLFGAASAALAILFNPRPTPAPQ